MTNQFLPYDRQVIADDDIAAVARVLRSDMLTTGPEIPAFEAQFAHATGAAHAIACSSGTAAVHLVAMAIGLGPGKSAIVPSITFLATANTVRLTGVEVVFADVDPETGLMTPETAEAAFGRASVPVAAIFPVHLVGQTLDMAVLRLWRPIRPWSIVEDACHALGSAYTTNGATHRVGACAHSLAATFSLHPVKTIAAGEGGVVKTQDAALRDKVQRLHNHGMIREGVFRNHDRTYAAEGAANPWYYEMPEPGFNYRLSDIQAALAASQLAKLDRFAEVRTRLVRYYEKMIAPLGNVMRPVKRAAGCSPVWHLFQVLVDFRAIGMDRAQLMGRLKVKGIGSQVHYIPVHRQPYYAERYPGTQLPGADAFYARTLSLPLFSDMDEGDVERVSDALRDIMRLFTKADK